ncbi:MAG: SRPBCC domain-containing protein [Chitinophagaceae bacterium]|nr:SRPBCC domain-containing protein [Chitinophagaceae bacterium]
MNSNLLFDFTTDKENKTIQVKREFDAHPELVWQAWTTAELLDQWWGPQPWRAETKTMDFREGGYWLYAMVGPEGEKHWAKASYISIVKEKSFTAKDGFCDENGTINTSFPQNFWENQFSAKEERTLVTVTLTFDHLKDLEQTIAMGFKEGFTIGLNQLDELLKKLKSKNQ